MPIVTFHPLGRQIKVADGTTLFDAARQAGLPVASSCQADLVCGKCHMEVLVGGPALSPETAEEVKLRRREHVGPGSRISCQTRVYGDCTVSTGYW